MLRTLTLLLTILASLMQAGEGCMRGVSKVLAVQTAVLDPQGFTAAQAQRWRALVISVARNTQREDV